MYIYAVVDTVTVHYGLIHSTGAINSVKLKILRTYGASWKIKPFRSAVLLQSWY